MALPVRSETLAPMTTRYGPRSFMGANGVIDTMAPETIRCTGTSSETKSSFTLADVTLLGSIASENVRTIGAVGSTSVAPPEGMLDISDGTASQEPAMHMPLVPVPHAGWLVCGGPDAMVRQRPREPGTSQAWQAPLQAASQQ